MPSNTFGLHRAGATKLSGFPCEMQEGGAEEAQDKEAHVTKGIKILAHPP